jgi:hypothetical protein
LAIGIGLSVLPLIRRALPILLDAVKTRLQNKTKDLLAFPFNI